MNYLVIIWQVAFVLIVLSLVWMATLVLLRIVRTQKKSYFSHLRQKITEAMAAILWDETGQAVIEDRSLWKSQMVPEVFLDFVALVRGEERDRLVRRLERNRVDDDMRRLLRHPRKFVRFAALEALAYFPGLPTAKSVDSLIERSLSPELRVAGMRTLVEIKSYPAVPDVMAEITKLNGGSRSLHAVLSKLALHRLRDVLAYLDRPDITDNERAALLRALGSSADYAVMDRLTYALEHGSAMIRAAALEGLARLEHPEAAPSIARCLKDNDWSVRAGAVRALREMSFDGYADDIAALLSDPAWMVQFEAAQALSQMGAIGRNLLEVSARAIGDEAASRTASLALAELSAAEALQ